ncbi:CPBP family intramembrane metalloprotease [Marinicella sp. S1101]|uniref:CPBP family intramembrane glutamic endopeptidase n=1 Tax=Marinicella marina TaxID=2996016 RepID=UPI002260EFD9|nr:CPBP family intramembrane glutamic endopeptidase [Marinicella marina]MCX7552248.1 CPBP family intramembrane metalloprotease [Marinicella marina]MDJ1139124.1 CPBP family intramembrane metalloprotease [Marinicella marina]
MIKDQLGLQVAPDLSNENAASKFGELAGNWALFLTLIPFIWLQSALEEILDRGFLINWIERALASTWFATIMAVLVQAMIFGFRHSYDISERSITVALIGLAMGIGYVAFGRNLWPLIIAHCILNTMSMLERV